MGNIGFGVFPGQGILMRPETEKQSIWGYYEPRMDSEGRREYTPPRFINPGDKNGADAG